MSTRHAAAAVLLAAALLAPGPAAAQVRASLEIVLPIPVPRLVLVEPGIQVVEAVDDEIFFVDGWYWLRRDAGWYRVRDARRGHWVYVEPLRVPRAIFRLPPGQYRRFDAAAWKAEKERRKQERKAWREAEREQRKDRDEARKERRKHEREEHRGHGHRR